MESKKFRGFTFLGWLTKKNEKKGREREIERKTEKEREAEYKKYCSIQVRTLILQAPVCLLAFTKQVLRAQVHNFDENQKTIFQQS